jgi:hypothetical protein
MYQSGASVRYARTEEVEIVDLVPRGEQTFTWFRAAEFDDGTAADRTQPV